MGVVPRGAEDAWDANISKTAGDWKVYLGRPQGGSISRSPAGMSPDKRLSQRAWRSSNKTRWKTNRPWKDDGKAAKKRVFRDGFVLTVPVASTPTSAGREAASATATAGLDLCAK